MNLLNIKTGHCITQTNIGWIILDLRAKKFYVHQKKKTLEGDMDDSISFPIELLTSENWLPIKDLDYFNIARNLNIYGQDNYLDNKFGKYFKPR